MALESCKVLMLSHSNFRSGVFFCVREGNLKTDGWTSYSLAFPYVLNKKPTYAINEKHTTNLMPIKLLTFNETETEE